MALDPIGGWLYYKEIVISDTSGVSADYQMMLTIYSGNGDDDTANGKIYCNNRCKDFADDIRFGTTKNPATATQLYQWEESSDAVSATVWVKCPADGSNTIYLFIGRADTDNFSDGANTFIAWDDFDEGYIIDEVPKAARGWTTTDIDANNYLKCTANPSGAGNVMRRVTAADIQNADLRLENFAVAQEVRIFFKFYGTTNTRIRMQDVTYEGGFAGTTIEQIETSRLGTGNIMWRTAVAWAEFNPQLDATLSTWMQYEERIYKFDLHLLLDGVDGDGGLRNNMVNGVDTWRASAPTNIATLQYFRDFFICKYTSATVPTYSSFGVWATPPKEILHLDPGPHPISRLAFYPRLTL